MAGCNVARVVNDLLARTESKPPSFTVHLYPEHWVLNNGSKFLYHNQTACLLDDIRARRIPVDFLDLFDSAKIPFYDGCMIVELLDYRPQRNKDPTPEKPLRSRVVLHPNSETLWADICSLNQIHGGKWTDLDALEIESKILLALSPPLCLNPDPHLTTVANHVLRASTPTVPASLKRKAIVLEPEDDENEKTRRAKIMAFGNSSRPKIHTPSYRLLDLMTKNKPAKSQPHALPGQMPGHQYLNQPQSSVATTAAPISQQVKAASPVGAPTVDKATPPQQTKAATPQTSYTSTAYLRAGDSHTPIPPPVTHQFINQHPPANPAQVQSMQPQVYANLQAATDAAKRAATPSQPHSQAQARPQPPQQPYSHLQPQSHYPPHTQLTSPTHAQSGLPQQAPPQHPQLQHHLPQQPQRPPSQPQPPQPSRTPIPIQTQPAHLQTQVVPSPIQHHSPIFQQHRPQSQPQPQPHQSIPQPHSSPQLQQLQQTPSHSQQTRTPQLSHHGSPLQAQAGTPHQYLQSPKPPTQSQTQPQTTPTPQPQSQPQPSQSHPHPHPHPPNTLAQAQTSTGQPIMQVHPQLMANFQGQMPPHLLQQQAAMARFKAPGQGQVQGQQQANANAGTPMNTQQAQLQMQMAQMQMQMQMPTAQQQQLQLLYAQQQYQRQLMAKTGRAGTPQMIPVQVGAAGAGAGVGQQGTAGAVGARASPMLANANGTANQQLAAAAAARGFPALTPQQTQYLQQQYLRTLAASSTAQAQAQQATVQGVVQGQSGMEAQVKQIQNQQQGQTQGQQQQQAQGQGHPQPGQQQPGQGQQPHQGQGQVKQTPQMSQAQAMSHHYYLPQMGYNMPNMAGYQWPGLGRTVGHGVAGMVNGQAMGMGVGGQQAQHAQQQVQQQMQIAMGSGVAQGVGKTAVQGQLPNR